jgi:predicted transcriptional regulator
MSFSGYKSKTDHQPDDKPSRKKPLFPVQAPLRSYLKHHGREIKLPVSYNDLLHFTYSVPLKDKKGDDTLWERTLYDNREWDFIREGLVKIYAILKTEGDLRFVKHLDVARVDYCTFGNSNPFRIRIVNKFNDNYDHYYIKIADASRIYGLELEHLLSPNRITFFTFQNTLVEEHIPGIPGDVFTGQMMDDPHTNKIRLAKEFVKFNERCFVRLLGDMRSYNFVVDITPDIEDYQYRIRCIDFDQQSYEGRKNFYLPQFFKQNFSLVELTLKHLNKDSIEQYQTEEKTMMAFRLASSRYRVKELLDIMRKDHISTPEKTEQLKKELAEWHKEPAFLKCSTAGDIVKMHLKEMLRKNLQLIPKLSGRFED